MYIEYRAPLVPPSPLLPLAARHETRASRAYNKGDAINGDISSLSYMYLSRLMGHIEKIARKLPHTQTESESAHLRPRKLK